GCALGPLLLAACGAVSDVATVTTSDSPAAVDFAHPATTQACIHRFDDIPPYDGNPGPEHADPVWQRWRDANPEAMQTAVGPVDGVIQVRKGVHVGTLQKGWVTWGEDPVRMRVVALVDAS